MRIQVDTGDVSTASAPMSTASDTLGTTQAGATAALTSAGAAVGDGGLAAAVAQLSTTMSGQLELGGYVLQLLSRHLQGASTGYQHTDTAIARAE
jgi:hypothetical protein